MTHTTLPPLPRFAAVGGALLLGFTLAMGATGAFAAIKPPGAQLIILAITLALVAATFGGRVRTWVDALPIRLLVGVHISRLVGGVFLALAARGLMSPLFATRAGWGDIAAAVIAAALVAWGAPNTAGRRAGYLAWSVFGMLDLIVAVGTATTVALRGDVPGMDLIGRIPLILVPMFFVPLLFASHVVVLRRLIRREGLDA